MISRGFRGRIAIGIILAGAVTLMEAQSGPAPTVIVTATAVMNEATARIGDRLVVTVKLERNAPSEARLEIAPPLGDFELVSVEHTAPRLRSSASIDEWRLTLVAFHPGRVTLPPINVVTAFSNGRSVVATTNPIEVNITAPEVTVKTPLRPLATAPPPVPQSPWPRVLVLGALVALVAGGIAVLAAYLWWRLDRRRRRLAYWGTMAQHIGEITRTSCDEWPRARAAYTRASTLLRRGTARATALPIEHVSRRDLLRHIATAERVGADLPRQAQRTLSRLDRVRFAKHAPSARVRDGLIQNVQTLFEVTRSVAYRNRR